MRQYFKRLTVGRLGGHPLAPPVPTSEVIDNTYHLGIQAEHKHLRGLSITSMAPLTCQVVDSDEKPVPGVHVVAACKDQCHNTIARFESYTNQWGIVDCWFPTPIVGSTAIIEPVSLDTAIAPRVSMTFSPNPYTLDPGSAWISMHSDMLLTGFQGHHIVLCVESSMSAYHMRHVTPSPIVPTVMDLDRKEVPSPFMLPPPLVEIPEVPESPPEEGLELVPKAVRGRKRKERTEENRAPPWKKSRGSD